MAAQGAGDSAIARALGLTRQTVIRIRRDPAAAGAMLDRWRLDPRPERAGSGEI